MTTANVNPFEVAQSWMNKKYKQGARQQRDIHQAQILHDALTVHAVTHESALKQAAQTARLAEKASAGAHSRATEFLSTVHGLAEPGTGVKISHGDISATFTKAMPTPPVQKPVPVKKSRGGKKNR